MARSILARRSRVEDDALHRPLGLVGIGAYVLGSAASFVGECKHTPPACIVVFKPAARSKPPQQSATAWGVQRLAPNKALP
jgi:hypothetical protein